MHKLTIYPLGNADCCRIDLECGRKMLIDYAATRDPNDENDLRADLPAELRADLEDAGRDYFDVVAFTHLDIDHFKGASEFFFFEHAQKYQGEGRVKINVMWVPAALITEKSPDDEEARILQREARHRFLTGKGIRVFSRPERLRKWCKDNGIKLEDRLALITDAGSTAPDFVRGTDGVEFFAHSPFAIRQNEKDVEDRNEDSLVFQATFEVQGTLTRALFLADSTNDVLAQIVDITKAKKNEQRLEWDIVKLPHHCSYLSIGPEKGEDKTLPVEQVQWLYEKKGSAGAIAVSTSKPTPRKGTPEDEDAQPPHRQAANYYSGVTKQLGGQFVVTMEHPTLAAPKPVIIEIGRTKGTLKKPSVTGAVAATFGNAPRAGGR